MRHALFRARVQHKQAEGVDDRVLFRVLSLQRLKKCGAALQLHGEQWCDGRAVRQRECGGDGAGTDLARGGGERGCGGVAVLEELVRSDDGGEQESDLRVEELEEEEERGGVAGRR